MDRILCTKKQIKWHQALKSKPFINGRLRASKKCAQKNHLFNLPVDLLLLIIAHLDLHDLFLFSQTSRAARHLLQQKGPWETTIAQLSRPQRLDFLTGLAYTMPRNWVCESCCKIHPDLRRDYFNVPHAGGTLSDCGHQEGRNIKAVYGLRHAHMQVALKHHARGLVEDDYYKRLMASFAESGYVRQSYHAAPRISGGRFLLHIHWTFDTTLFVREMEFARVCPHLMFIPHTDDGMSYRRIYLRPERYGPSAFEDAVLHAASRVGQDITDSCELCPTDYSVLYDGHTLYLQIWHDFGPYASPASLSWKVHVLDRERPVPEAPILRHDPGSVRKMYAEGYRRDHQRVVEMT